MAKKTGSKDKKKAKITVPETARLVTGVVRLTFVHVWKPDAFEGNEPKYSVMLIIPKDDKETIKKIKGAQERARLDGISEKWNGKEPKKLKLALKDAEDAGFDAEEFEEFEDAYILRCSSKFQPQVIDRYKEEVTEEDGVIYSGCYARVSVTLFPYATAGNKGVSAQLNSIQYIKPGKKLGGSISAQDEFDEFEGDDDDDWDDDDE